MRTHRFYFTLFLSFLLTAKLIGQSTYFPEEEWEIKKPAEVGMNETVVKKAVQFAIEIMRILLKRIFVLPISKPSVESLVIAFWDLPKKEEILQI